MFRPASFALLLLAAACSRAPAEPQVTVENATVSVPAVPGGAGAAYFTLRSNQEQTRLVSLTSPSIERIEFLLGVARFGPIYIDEPNLLACRL